MIRRITEVDHEAGEAITRLGRQFYQQSGMPGEFQSEMFVDFWRGAIASGIASQWVSLTDDKIVGTIGMLMIMSPFTGEIVAEETFWFVESDHRGTAGVRLFAEAEAWAKALGCNTMKVGYLNSLGAEKLHAFYERRGFTVLQTQFMKKL